MKGRKLCMDENKKLSYRKNIPLIVLTTLSLIFILSFFLDPYISSGSSNKQNSENAISNFVQENCREEQVPYEEVEEYIETIPYTEEECHAENLIYSKIDSSWDYANCLDDDTICYEEGFLGRWPIIEECME